MSGEAGCLGASVARGALTVLSKPYGLASGLAEIVRAGRDAVEVGLPVVSVGNITAGGTGKTPFVAFVVTDLKKRKLRPVVLSRGYRADGTGRNDEAKVLARLHPDVLHLQGRDRVALARYAADARLGDVLVLDDGFQYQRLARHLNVCCLDATNPFGFGAVLPRGLLREPLAGLYRARPIVITRAELATPQRIAEIEAEALKHHPYAKFVVSEMRATGLREVRGGAVTGVDALRDAQVVLASGIGNPEAFARDVRVLGGRVREHVVRPDHHDWTAEEAKALAAAARAPGVAMVVTTAKDAVKLEAHDWPAGAPPLVSLEIEAAIVSGAEVWSALLDEALAAV